MKKELIFAAVIAGIALLSGLAVLTLRPGTSEVPPVTFTPSARQTADTALDLDASTWEYGLLAVSGDVTAPLYGVIVIEVWTVVGIGVLERRPCDWRGNTCHFETGAPIIGNGGDPGADNFGAVPDDKNLSPSQLAGPGFADPVFGIGDIGLCGVDPDSTLDPCAPQYFVGEPFSPPIGPSRANAVLPTSPNFAGPPRPIPEPGSLALFAGALLLGWPSRRRR